MDNLTDLSAAVINEDVEKIKELISQGVDVNEYVISTGWDTSNGAPALIYSASSGYIKSFKTLVECGADVNQIGKHGENVLDYITYGFEMIDNEDDKIDIINYLLDKGFKGRSFTEHSIDNLMEEENRKIFDLLMEKGFKFDSPGIIEKALVSAASSGNIDVVRMLIDMGAEVNNTASHDWSGKSALIAACRSNQLHVAKYLIDIGADINVIADSETTALNSISLEYWDRKRDEYVEIIKLLLDKGADINAESDYGTTILNQAARYGDIETFNYLLKKGATINTKTIIEACSGKNISIVKLLLEMGEDVNAKDNDGFTALYRAVQGGELDIVKALIENGADINIKYSFIKKGQTVLSLAEEYGHDDIIDYLIGKGGSKSKSDVDGKMIKYFKKKFDWLKTAGVDDLIEECNENWVAAYMLGSMGDSRAVEPLIDSLEYDVEEEEPIRILKNIAAIYSLGKLKDNRAVAPLVRILKKYSYEMKWMAAWALGEIGDKKCLKDLEKALENDEYDSVWSSSTSVTGDMESGDNLVELFYDEEFQKDYFQDRKTIIKFLNEYIHYSYIFKQNISPIIGAIKKLSKN